MALPAFGGPSAPPDGHCSAQVRIANAKTDSCCEGQCAYAGARVCACANNSSIILILLLTLIINGIMNRFNLRINRITLSKKQYGVSVIVICFGFWYFHCCLVSSISLTRCWCWLHFVACGTKLFHQIVRHTMDKYFTIAVAGGNNKITMGCSVVEALCCHQTEQLQQRALKVL